jgi:Predicted solute binding protein
MNKYSLVQSILVLITVLAVASMNTVNTNSSPETIIKCMDITTPGYYYLSSNITGIQESRERCIGIFANNVVLDGGGFSMIGEGGFGLFIKAINVTVRNIAISGYDIGVRLDWGSSNNTLISVNVLNNKIGVQLIESNYNTLAYITASNNEYGIQLNSCKNNTITNSLIINNEADGIQLGSTSYNVYSSYNTIANTTVSNNGNAGINLLDSTYYLNVVNTTLSNNNYGLYIKNSGYNTVVDSIIISNNYGVVLDTASKNVFYNNLFNNTFSNVIIYEGSNTWSMAKTPGRNIIGGSYIGGNYWTNPKGEDFSDTCRDNNNDGLCDEPYIIDENNVDYYPLKTIHEISTQTTGTTITSTTTQTTTSSATTTWTSRTTPATHATSPTSITSASTMLETTTQGQDSMIRLVIGIIFVIGGLILLLLPRLRRK